MVYRMGFRNQGVKKGLRTGSGSLIEENYVDTK